MIGVISARAEEDTKHRPILQLSGWRNYENSIILS